MIWQQRVRDYLNELEAVAELISQRLESVTVSSTATRPEDIAESSEGLQSALVELEEKVARREGLLQDPEAPSAGLTLAEKLRNLDDVESHRLAERCDQVAAQIGDANNRAVSLFVCQYHLSNMTTEIVRLIAGGPSTTTYDPPGRSTKIGGSLFNESV